jgi:hypothetical protein
MAHAGSDCAAPSPGAARHARANTACDAAACSRHSCQRAQDASRYRRRAVAVRRPSAAVCRLGMSPAPLLVDGAVVTGTTQGMLRIFDGETGDVLFEYMTNRDFPNTVNGVEGHGGGLDSAPYIAGDGTLFVQSGYARFGEPQRVDAFSRKSDEKRTITLSGCAVAASVRRLATPAAFPNLYQQAPFNLRPAQSPPNRPLEQWRRKSSASSAVGDRRTRGRSDIGIFVSLPIVAPTFLAPSSVAACR